MICKFCSAEKPESEFGKAGRRCSTCVKEWHAEHYQKPEVKAKHLEQGRRWREANREKQREMDLKSRLKTRYDMTLAQYKALLEIQGGKCAICSSETPKRKRALGFFVDHCHFTGRVRGLLCHRCNLAVGWMEDNIALVTNVSKYLETF